MQIDQVGLFGVVVPLVGAGTVLVFSGFNRQNRRRFRKELEAAQSEREAMLLLASVLQQTDEASLTRSGGQGQVAMIGDGTFGSGQLPFMLQGYVRANAPGFVGGTFLLEPDLGRQDVAAAQIPSVFRPLIVHPDMYLFPGGMSGKSVAQVLAIKHKWEPEVRRRTERWMKVIKASTKPAVLLVFISSGGSAALARGAIERFHESYPEVPIYVITILDEKTIGRARFPEIREYYAHDHLVTQFIVCDNRRFQRASDLGISMFFPGMTVAPWLKPQSLDLWNLGPYAFPVNGKVEPRFATLSVFAEYLPVRYVEPWKGVLPELYLTDAALVEDIAMRGIQNVVENAALQSVALPKAKEGTSRVVLVAAPIHPRDFARNIVRIEEGLDAWRRRHDIDVQLCYANIKAPMNPLTDQVPLVVVYLQPLDASDYDVDQLALGNTPVDPSFLPPDQRGNGHYRALEA